jgi:ribosomal protein S18 acetylase RimI-like enzyme
MESKEFVLIRRVVKEEASLLREVQISTFRETFAAFNTEENMRQYISDSFSEEKVEKELMDPHSTFYFADWEGIPVGYLKVNAAAAQTDLNDPFSLEIERIYVLQSMKGKKIGKKLMEQAFLQAKSMGCGYVWLGVWEKNQPAIAFYEKTGFRVFGEHSFVLGEDIQKDLLMRKDVI